MRRNDLLAAGCMVLLSACAPVKTGNAGQTAVMEESGVLGESGDLDESGSAKVSGTLDASGTSDASASSETGHVGMTLTREAIDTICGQLYSSVNSCGDGSQIITAGISGSDSCIYIRYMPQARGDGNYSFFRAWTPSYEVSGKMDGSVDIPIHINDSDRASLILNAVYSVQDREWDMEQATLSCVNQEDAEFHQMYDALDSGGQQEYRLSLKPDRSMTEDQLAGFFRSCVYNGNFQMLDHLYELTPVDSQEERYKLELAGSREWDAKLTYSAANPYLPEIYYGESCGEFPQREVLEFVAEEVRMGAGLEEMGAERIEPNADWESVYHLPGFQELYQYVYEDERVTGVYKYDLDQDGLSEILILFPGGSMGNHFWEVLHLNEAGEITDTNSGEGLGYVSLYQYHGTYFFANDIYDYNDREHQGWQVHVLNQNGQMYMADIFREKMGTEVVFTDQYVELDHSYYLDWELDRYIDKYKAYETQPLGSWTEAGEEIWNLFGLADDGNGTYGLMDFNNDGTDDWTYTYKFYPSGRYPYYCHYEMVDGKTDELLDFSKLEDLSYNLRCMFPYRSDGKNYVICVLNGDGNYVFKLIEIQGMEPVEIQNWFASVKNRVLVHVYENHGERLGI